MITQKNLVLIPGVACFLAFSWGTFRHFRPAVPMPWGMRLVEAVSLVTMTAFAWSVLNTTMPETWPAAPMVLIVSLVLFTWTVRATRTEGFALAFTGAQPSRLITNGPFRYLRHPFYTSYLLFWLAACLATNAIICELGSIALSICYIIAARDEEHRISRDRFAGEYATYASETGMFLPRCRRKPRWTPGSEV